MNKIKIWLYKKSCWLFKSKLGQNMCCVTFLIIDTNVNILPQPWSTPVVACMILCHPWTLLLILTSSDNLHPNVCELMVVNSFPQFALTELVGFLNERSKVYNHRLQLISKFGKNMRTIKFVNNLCKTRRCKYEYK